MEIRRALLRDARGIAEVSVKAWRSTYKGIVADEFLKKMSVEERKERWNKKITNKEEVIYVAEEDQTIIGYASGGQEREGIAGYDAELYAIYLLDAYQRQGVGKKLLQSLTGALLLKGYRSIIVWVLAENRTKVFYEVLDGKYVAEDVIVLSGIKHQLIGYGWGNMVLLNKNLTVE